MILLKLITRDSHFFFILLNFDVNILRKRLFSFKKNFYLTICFIFFRLILINKIIKFEINIIIKILFNENIINVNYIFSFNAKINIDYIFLFELEINANEKSKFSIDIISHFENSIFSRKNSVIFFFLL